MPKIRSAKALFSGYTVTLSSMDRASKPLARLNASCLSDARFMSALWCRNHGYSLDVFIDAGE